MGDWKVKGEYQDFVDTIARTKHVRVENVETGEKREVLTNSWDKGERLGQKISKGEFLD